MVEKTNGISYDKTNIISFCFAQCDATIKHRTEQTKCPQESEQI